MDVDPAICAEWQAHHSLDATALHWLHEHADPGDTNPIVTAIAELRRLERESL